MGDLLIRRTAQISQCGTWRYTLGRYWSSAPVLPFVMLNPSTADADIDDPTIRRCMAFARREGAGGIIVGNLFAFRATDPKLMSREPDPVGPENRNALADIAGVAIASGQPVVCAWGVHGTFRDADSIGMKQMAPARLVCLGITKDGHPRHPLYVKGDQPLVGFPNACPRWLDRHAVAAEMGWMP